MTVTHTTYSDSLYVERVTLQIQYVTAGNKDPVRAGLAATEAKLRELGHLVTPAF